MFKIIESICLKIYKLEKLILNRKEVKILVFLFVILIFLFLILSILTLKIEIEVVNLKISSKKIKGKYINSNFEISIVISIFEKIHIGKIVIDEEKLVKLSTNKKYKSKIDKINREIINNENNIDRKIFEIAKKVRFNIKKIELYIELGTENAALTALIIPFLSTIVVLFLKKYLEKEYTLNFEIKPIYIDKNIFNFNFEGIFEIKLIHIIDTICKIRKERKGEKYERTSNRRSYDYSYE